MHYAHLEGNGMAGAWWRRAGQEDEGWGPAGGMPHGLAQEEVGRHWQRRWRQLHSLPPQLVPFDQPFTLDQRRVRTAGVMVAAAALAVHLDPLGYA